MCGYDFNCSTTHKDELPNKVGMNVRFSNIRGRDDWHCKCSNIKSLKDRVYIRRKRNRPIGSKYKIPWRRKGTNDQYGHDNEASAIKEHIDITLYKTSKKVKVHEKWRDLDKLCYIEIDIK